MRKTNNHNTILEFGSAHLHLGIYDKNISLAKKQLMLQKVANFL